MNIKKFLGLQSKEDKIQEYKQLLEKSYKNSLRVDELAAEFSEQNSVLKSISTLSEEDRKEVEERNKKFISDHVKNISEAYKEKTSIEKSMIKLESDVEIADILKDMKSLYNSKRMYKDKQISKSIYNDIIKAKTGKVRYADVLLFRGPKLLILQRAGDQGNHTDEWCIPGGHVDAGEDFRTAAQRELLEETGIDIPEDILAEVAVATGKDFEIHYFVGHVSEETPAFVVVDSEEEIGSAWIEPGTELDDYEFIFDMKDNLKKILGLEQKPSNLIKIQKAYFNGDISEEVFKSYCEQHPDEIEKANNKTYFSHKERKDLAERGEAMPNGKYPIRNSQDLKDAIRLVGASDMSESKVKAWIKKRAKELGLENELPKDWIEKTMSCEDITPLQKEDLEKDAVGPQGDGVGENEIEKAVDGFKILIDFNDLDQAQMFKSLVNEMRESGKLDINNVLDQQEEIEKSWGINEIREEAWSDPSLDDGSQIEKAKKGYPVGTEKTYNGKQYVKTDKGWRLKKKEVTSRERFEKEKNERYSKMDKRSFAIADKIAKEILDEGLVDEDTNELTMSHVIRPKIDKMINEQTKDWGVKASELKPGEVVHINEFPTSVKLTYKGEENGKYIFERENGEVEKVRSKSRVFHRDDQLIDKTAVAWKVRDILNKKRTGWFGKSENVEFEKAKDLMYGVFVDYANFLEGVKTRTKNIHWGELDNSKHVYLDDLIDELSDYEDKIMEAGQSGFGRFGDDEVNGEEIEENEPIELIDLIIERTKDFHEAIKDNINYVGEMSWIEDFLATLKQTKYRLQLH
jgi:8-oxo-dGTP pyrophosphatase MutT (NUDIX family)